MALPATDTFTASDGTALTTYSASWTYNIGTFAINTNAVYCSAAVNFEAAAKWTADAFANDQYAQGVCVTESSSGGSGAAVRCGTGANYYGYYNDTTGSYLHKNVGGTWTQIGSNGPSLAVNDVIRLEVEGTTLRPKINGTLVAAIGAQTDSTFSSGSAGISFWGGNPTARLDNWEGGNIGGAAVASFIVQRRGAWRRNR